MPRNRPAAAGMQWRRLQAMVDHEFADESLARAVAAGRGIGFERLEFLGDPVLELAVATGLVHAAARGHETAAAELARRVARSTDGRALAGTSLARQLSSLVGFRTSRKRRGDMVEACAGALFVDAGWPAVDELAAAAGLIPEPPPLRPPPEPGVETARVADGPRDLLAALESRGGAGELARARVVGTMVVDCAVAWWAYRTMPGRDEGVLSTVAHERASNPRLAAAANRNGLPDTHGRAENRLRAWLGLVTERHGRQAAIDMASEVLNLGLPIRP